MVKNLVLWNVLCYTRHKWINYTGSFSCANTKTYTETHLAYSTKSVCKYLFGVNVANGMGVSMQLMTPE